MHTYVRLAPNPHLMAICTTLLLHHNNNNRSPLEHAFSAIINILLPATSYRHGRETKSKGAKSKITLKSKSKALLFHGR